MRQKQQLNPLRVRASQECSVERSDPGEEEEREARRREDGRERAMRRAWQMEIEELARQARGELEHLNTFVLADKATKKTPLFCVCFSQSS